jgi:hypothetical protein
VNTDRAVGLATTVAAAVALSSYLTGGIPIGWAVAISLPVGAAVLVWALLSGTYDVHWAPEPHPSSTGFCRHANTLTDRLAKAATDPYWFTSRIQPRLRRIALDTLRRKQGIDDLGDPRARELLGADLYQLITARDARLPPATTFAVLVRRLEEL